MFFDLRMALLCLCLGAALGTIYGIVSKQINRAGLCTDAGMEYLSDKCLTDDGRLIEP